MRKTCRLCKVAIRFDIYSPLISHAHSLAGWAKGNCRLSTLPYNKQRACSSPVLPGLHARSFPVCRSEWINVLSPWHYWFDYVCVSCHFADKQNTRTRLSSLYQMENIKLYIFLWSRRYLAFWEPKRKAIQLWLVVTNRKIGFFLVVSAPKKSDGKPHMQVRSAALNADLLINISLVIIPLSISIVTASRNISGAAIVNTSSSGSLCQYRWVVICLFI